MIMQYLGGGGPQRPSATTPSEQLTPPHVVATDIQNAGAAAAGGAALGAVVALAVSTAVVSPIVGAALGGVIGGVSGNNINRVVRWWSHRSDSDL